MPLRFDNSSTVAERCDYRAHSKNPWSDASGTLSKKRLLENIRCIIKKRPAAHMLRAEAGLQCKVGTGPNRVHLPQEMLCMSMHAPRPLSPCARQLDVFDFMTTSSEVCNAARRLNMRAETFGIELDAREDILTEQGLTLAWRKLKRVRRGGLFVVQPPSLNHDVHAGRALREAGSTKYEATRMANRTASPVASLYGGLWSTTSRSFWSNLVAACLDSTLRIDVFLHIWKDITLTVACTGGRHRTHIGYIFPRI